MKTCFSEEKPIKQFGNSPFLRQPPYFCAIFSWPPLFVQILKIRTPPNLRGGDCVCIARSSKKVGVIIFPLILSHFSFVSNATNSLFRSLNRFILEKKKNYALLVSFNLVPFSFLVYANIPFKCLQIGLRGNPFWCLCRINSFQNQYNYLRNLNLIGTYLDQT